MERSSSPEPEIKLPLKRVKLSVSKFNELAIPHHLDLLRQHNANIIKYSEAGEYVKVRVEEEGARRAATRLRALLAELDALRAAVRAPDRPAFDVLTARALADARRALALYTHESSPMTIVREASGTGTGGGGGGGAGDETGAGGGSVTSTESVGVVRGEELDVQLQVEEGSRDAEDALRGLAALQEEVGALHATWVAVHEAARGQREHVERTGERIEVAAAEVEAARGHLALGERLRGAAAGAGGAALGALAGGPVGLVVGLKAGAVAALAGSLLGYAAGRLLPARRRALAPAPAPAPAPDEPPYNKDKAA